MTTRSLLDPYELLPIVPGKVYESPEKGSFVTEDPYPGIFFQWPETLRYYIDSERYYIDSERYYIDSEFAIGSRIHKLSLRRVVHKSPGQVTVQGIDDSLDCYEGPISCSPFYVMIVAAHDTLRVAGSKTNIAFSSLVFGLAYFVDDAKSENGFMVGTRVDNIPVDRPLDSVTLSRCYAALYSTHLRVHAEREGRGSLCEIIASFTDTLNDPANETSRAGL